MDQRRRMPMSRFWWWTNIALGIVGLSACSEGGNRSGSDSADSAPTHDVGMPTPGAPSVGPTSANTPTQTQPATPATMDAPTKVPAPTSPSETPAPSPAPDELGSGGADDDPQGGAGGQLGAAGASAGVSPGGSGGAPGAGGSVDDGVTEEPAVRFVGRFVDAGSGGKSFEWSGSGIIAAFDGTSVSVTLDDSGNNEFTVLVDGELGPKLVASAGSNDYELASGLPAGRHVVELYRRTEASFGTTTFERFDFGAGVLLAPPAPATHRMEVIGDSITCGYGNEGESATCGFSADTENHYATYGAIAARALDADLVTIAWSGKGIVYNYDTDTNDPLPALYDRALPTQAASTWDFSWMPEVVVINLGTNDFSTDGDPTPDLFRDEYAAFLARLRDAYPNAYILCTVGPLLSGADLDAARAGIEAAVTVRESAGDAQLGIWEMNISNDNPGCDYHPGLATHEAMGAALVTELQTRLSW